jgi:hypothetical protein
MSSVGGLHAVERRYREVGTAAAGDYRSNSRTECNRGLQRLLQQAQHERKNLR